MSFGNTRKRTDLKAYAFRIKTKDLAVPYFEVQVREGEGWVPLTESVKDAEGNITGTKPVTAQNVEGNLLAVESKSFVHKGQKIKNTSITLQDKDQIYFVTVPNTLLGRSILNRLINLKEFANVNIGLYTSKPKTEGGKSYHQASVRQNDEIVKWKYDNDKLPKPVEVRKESGELLARDFDKLDAFFEKEILELNTKIKKGVVVAPTPAAVEATTEHTATTEATVSEEPKTTSAEDPDGDIPF